MSHSPGIGAHVQEAANGVDTPESPKLCGEEAPLDHISPTPQPLKCGEIVACRGPELTVGSTVEEMNCEAQPKEERRSCVSDTPCSGKPRSDACSEQRRTDLLHTDTPHNSATEDHDNSFPDDAQSVEGEEEEEEEDAQRVEGEGAEEQEEEEEEVNKNEEEDNEDEQHQQQQKEEVQKEGQEDTEDAPKLSADPPAVSGPPAASQTRPKDRLLVREQKGRRAAPSRRRQEPPCPPHVMAQVHVRNAPERERIARGMQDSKSLDEISQVCGGVRGRGGQPEGRRATISSALELEGTVSHDGELTHFITKNLEHKIRMSSRPSLDSDSDYPVVRGRGSLRRPVDIPPIDPNVLLDLQRHTQDVAQSVELMMRSLNGTIQNMTALSVGYIQTYRDSVDSLGEAVDMSIKGMYTLMARCEELDRSMQPIHTLAQQIRDIKRTLDALETLCK